MVGDGVAAAAAFTGRANLYAESAGVTAYDPARLNAFNLVDEAVTLALVPPYQAVEQGQMMGTLKIIPFAVPEDVVLLTESIARGDSPMVRVATFRPTKVGLVQTSLPGTKESVLDSTLEVTSGRLNQMGSEVCHEVRCDHAPDALAKATQAQLRNGAQMVQTGRGAWRERGGPE